MSWGDDTAQRLSKAKTLWDAVCAPMEICDGAPSTDPARHTGDEDRHSAWADLSVEAESELDRETRRGTGNDELTDEDRIAIVELIRAHEGFLGVDAVDAVAWGLDIVAGDTFVPSWTVAKRDAHGECFSLEPGEFFPVPDAAVEINGRNAKLTPRGSSLPKIPAGELPHVRRFDGSLGFEVVVSIEHTEALEAIAYSPAPVGAGHLNTDSAEFDFPHLSDPPTPDIYPIRASDLATQRDRTVAVVQRAIERGLRILVLPELSSDPTLIAELQDLVDDPTAEDFLLIAGSSHEMIDGRRTNIARGLLASSRPLAHHKLIRFTNELRPGIREREGIETPPPAVLTIHQAGRFRFAILICKDILDTDLVRLVKHVGANVVCVPTMSSSTSPYHARVLELVAASQALTIVANGPITWTGAADAVIHAEDACIVGQPIPRRMLIHVADHQLGSAPQLISFKVGGAAADID